MGRGACTSWWCANEGAPVTVPGGASSPNEPRGELRVVGTSVAREIELMLDRVAQALGRRAPRVLQVGSRTQVADRNERNWRNLVGKRFEGRGKFVGIDLLAGSNVDSVLDICSAPRAVTEALGEDPFDLVICCHVLEHTRHPARAAANIQRLLRPGGLAYVSTPWSQAFHATPDDYWRFSIRGLVELFSRLEILSAFYCGGDVGLDVAYRLEREGRPETGPRAGAVEQGLFQLVLDHEDNRALLARQATERLPVSRTYLPTLFANVVGRRKA
jgi:SAM-dependent methyltransferase